MSASAFLLCAAIAISLGACVPSDLIDNRRCPCLVGWSCNDENTCVRGELTDAGSPDASIVARTCWRTGRVCDWSDEAAFDLVEDDGSVFAQVNGTNYVYSPDGCTILYKRDQDLFFARRAGPDTPFVGQVPFEVNTELHEVRASIRADGLELLFVRNDSGNFHVFRSRRASTLAAWPMGSPVDPLNEPGLDTFDMTLAPSGLTVYFVRRLMTDGRQEIYTAGRASFDGEFDEPQRIPDFGVDLDFAEPSVAFGEKVLTVVSQMDGDEAQQLYYSTRPDREARWGPLQSGPGAFLESGDEQEAPLSPDGCEVLTRRDGAVHRLLYVPR